MVPKRSAAGVSEASFEIQDRVCFFYGKRRKVSFSRFLYKAQIVLPIRRSPLMLYICVVAGSSALF